MSDVLDQRSKWREVLKQHRVFLESKLNVNDIYSHLLRDNVLTNSQGEEMKSASSSPRFQAERLLGHLNRQTEQEFKSFMKILETCEYGHLATKIKEVRPQTDGDQPHWKFQLQQCQVVIVNDLGVAHIKSDLIEKGIINERHSQEIMMEPSPTSESAKIRCFLDHLCCRTERDFTNFLDCLKADNNHVRKEVEKELAQLVAENDLDKKPFWKTAINNKRNRLSGDLVIRDFCDCLIQKGVLDQDKLEECTQAAVRTRKMVARAFIDVLSTKEKHHFDLFLKILYETDNSHLADPLKSDVSAVPVETTLFAQETNPPGVPPYSPHLLPSGSGGDDTSDGTENTSPLVIATQPTAMDLVSETLQGTHIDGEAVIGSQDVTDNMTTGNTTETEQQNEQDGVVDVAVNGPQPADRTDQLAGNNTGPEDVQDDPQPDNRPAIEMTGPEERVTAPVNHPVAANRDASANYPHQLQEAFTILQESLGDQTQVRISRERLLGELVAFYDSEEVATKTLHVTFLGEDGEDMGGLTKDLHTNFWRQAMSVYFKGELAVVPHLPLKEMRTKKQDFRPLGRILAHTAALLKILPPRLSRTFVLSLIFDSEGVSEETLKEDFLLFITQQERRLVEKALHGMGDLTSSESDDLQSFFTSYGLVDAPRQNVLEDQLLTMATNELLDKPAPLVSLMRKGIPDQQLGSFWTGLTIDHIEHLFEAQRPTPAKVAATLTPANEDLRNEEASCLYYLRQYVGSMEQEDLEDFLLFTTASTVMPEVITIAFINISGLERRPIAHTCANVLELPSTYESYQEFRGEWRAMLSNEASFEMNAW